MAPSLLCVLNFVLFFAFRVMLEQVVPRILFPIVAIGGQLDDVVQSLLDIFLLVVCPFVFLVLNWATKPCLSSYQIQPKDKVPPCALPDAH